MKVVTELVIACDPDSQRSALAWAVCREPGALRSFDFVDVDGGGTGKPGRWQTGNPMLGLLHDLSEEYDINASRITVVCETQAPDGPRSADVEALRRVRYHWEAACEITGAKFVEAIPIVWMRSFVGEQSLGAGSLKKIYQRRAKELTPLATNEDRCAAIGILDWYVRSIGSRLVFKGE